MKNIRKNVYNKTEVNAVLINAKKRTQMGKSVRNLKIKLAFKNVLKEVFGPLW